MNKEIKYVVVFATTDVTNVTPTIIRTRYTSKRDEKRCLHQSSIVLGVDRKRVFQSSSRCLLPHSCRDSEGSYTQCFGKRVNPLFPNFFKEHPTVFMSPSDSGGIYNTFSYISFQKYSDEMRSTKKILHVFRVEDIDITDQIFHPFLVRTVF